MQLKHAMIGEIVVAGKRRSHYSPPSTAAHRQLISLICDLAHSGGMSFVDYGYALKALSGGSTIDIQAQVAANLKYLRSESDAVATDTRNASITADLELITERLKKDLIEIKREKNEEVKKVEKRQVARDSQVRRKLERRLETAIQEREKKAARQEKERELAKDEYVQAQRRQQKKVLRERLAPWLDIVNALKQYPKYDVETTAPTLNSEDRALAKEWLPRSVNYSGYESARLLSARIAEKAAAKIYKKTGSSVVDVSVSQLFDGQAKDWIQYDLLVNNVPIDVKNTRGTPNRPDNYVEHCVPQFKSDRRRQDVRIAGLLSTYLTERELNEGKQHSVTFLGETCRSCIEELQTEFSNEFFEVDLVREGRQGYFLPPWLFEYPREFYDDTGVDFGIDLFGTAWPKKTEFQALWTNPLPILCIRQAPNNFSYDGRPNDVALNIARQIAQKVERLGRFRPVVWLAVLTSVLRLIAEDMPKRGWQPSDLIPMLFAGERDPIAGYKRPLGCYDPLRTIHSLVQVLDTVWCEARTQVSQFKSFKLVNSRILMGRSGSGKKWQTIVAYCGGRDALSDGSRVPCGNSPIYLGREKACEECGKLICSDCGFCMKDCALVGRHRQEARKRRRRDAVH